VPPDRRVYLRGWAAQRSPYVAEHAELSRSPAMAAASGRGVARCGVGIDDVAHLDLYSCFGSSIRFAQDALGLRPDDGRGVTVTGGLPFAGGPGSGYLLHAVAAMVEALRRDPGSFGLVSGVGMHMTKHVFGVYSTQPGPFAPSEPVRIDADRPLRDTATGPATVVAYTVAHDRSGDPEWGLLVCELEDGSRCYAKILDTAALADAERTELVGQEVTLEQADENTNIARL
jgi:acetyl-CoA C-acetyltransferase